MSRLRVGIVGAGGRAGGAMALALDGRAQVERIARDRMSEAATVADVVILAVPDAAIAECARSIAPAGAVVVHLSGVTTLDALAPHRRVGSLHPLASMPDAALGAERLRGAWMAVAGDAIVDELVALLGGRSFRVPDAQRALYHAAACIASNHLVALLAQVDRLAAQLGVPLAPFLDIASGSIANVAALGPADALTGPVRRGDWETVRRHLAALDPAERPLYVELARAAAALAGRELPADVHA